MCSFKFLKGISENGKNAFAICYYIGLLNMKRIVLRIVLIVSQSMCSVYTCIELKGFM